MKFFDLWKQPVSIKFEDLSLFYLSSYSRPPERDTIPQIADKHQPKTNNCEWQCENKSTRFGCEIRKLNIRTEIFSWKLTGCPKASWFLWWLSDFSTGDPCGKNKSHNCPAKKYCWMHGGIDQVLEDNKKPSVNWRGFYCRHKKIKRSFNKKSWGI